MCVQTRRRDEVRILRDEEMPFILDLKPGRCSICPEKPATIPLFRGCDGIIVQ